MKLLLDTHSFLWFIAGDAHLSPVARAAIEDSLNTTYVSVASVWEIAIKSSIGKLSIAGPLEQFISDHLRHNGFQLLPLNLKHVAAVATLPLHHRDPFDRILTTQAMIEGMSLVGTDAAFEAYGIHRIW